MTNKEAIEYIKANYPDNHRYEGLCEALDLAIDALEKIDGYRILVDLLIGEAQPEEML